MNGGSRAASRRTLREFGLVVGGLLAVAGAWWTWRDRFGWGPEVLLGCGLALALAGALVPQRLRWLYGKWMALAEALGAVVGTVALAVVFFGVMTPIGLLRRLSGADPLLRRAPRAVSWWQPYSPRVADPKHFEKMY